MGNLAAVPLHHLANLRVVRGVRQFQENGRAVRILGRDVDLAVSGINVALLPVVDPDAPRPVPLERPRDGESRFLEGYRDDPENPFPPRSRGGLGTRSTPREPDAR